jgi:hypothetical protein
MTGGNFIAILFVLAVLYGLYAFGRTKWMHKPTWPFKNAKL